MEVVAGLGGPDEMERLLALGEQELQEECNSIPLHLRKAGLVQGSSLHLRQPSRYTSVDVDPATPGRRSLAVSSGTLPAALGLFRQWLIQAGARLLGVEAALEELLRPSQQIPKAPRPVAAVPSSCCHTVPCGLGRVRPEDVEWLRDNQVLSAKIEVSKEMMAIAALLNAAQEVDNIFKQLSEWSERKAAIVAAMD